MTAATDAELDDEAGARLLRDEAERIVGTKGPLSVLDEQDQQPPDKDVDKEKKEQEKKQRHDKIQAEKERKREEHKSNPLLRASKWVSGVNNYLGQCHAMKSLAERATKIDNGIRQCYVQKFDDYETRLKRLRDSIEALQLDGDATALKAELAKAQTNV